MEHTFFECMECVRCNTILDSIIKVGKELIDISQTDVQRVEKKAVGDVVWTKERINHGHISPTISEILTSKAKKFRMLERLSDDVQYIRLKDVKAHVHMSDKGFYNHMRQLARYELVDWQKFIGKVQLKIPTRYREKLLWYLLLKDLNNLPVEAVHLHSFKTVDGNMVVMNRSHIPAIPLDASGYYEHMEKVHSKFNRETRIWKDSLSKQEVELPFGVMFLCP